MKKIYLSVLAGAFAFNLNAQLTLTKALYEPVAGDVNARQGYDSTIALSNSAGTNQNWNFSSLTSNTITQVTTFTPAASTPSASAFPGATLADDDGAGNYNYYKSTASTYELMGFVTSAGSNSTFTNSGIVATWPVSYGYTGTDNYSGSVNYLSLVGPANGTVTGSAAGSGTLTLPGSLVFNNCLQFKLVNKTYASVGSFPLTFTIDIVTTEYQYYHSSQKFPILVVSYNSQTLTSASGPSTTDDVSITVNSNVLTGINNMNFDAANYNVYPNPATDHVNINLTNGSSEKVSVLVVNALGQVVKSVELSGMDINYPLNTADLPKGMYHITTSIGEKSTTKKLIIQ